MRRGFKKAVSEGKRFGKWYIRQRRTKNVYRVNSLSARYRVWAKNKREAQKLHLKHFGTKLSTRYIHLELKRKPDYGRKKARRKTRR